MIKFFGLIVVGCLLISCKQEIKNPKVQLETKTTIKYAKGFKVIEENGLKIIHIKNPWPGATESFKYAIVPKGSITHTTPNIDAVIPVPIEKIVVTSTTHIPSLEMLGLENKLVGFPNLDYISSEKTRKLIDNGTIKELGKNEDLNTEVLIDLQPDVVITFAVKGGNKTVSTIQKTGIPVMYNGDWTETHPLGKAEWIKFFGILFNKKREADSIFSEIEKSYNQVKELVATTSSKPTVLSGAMYKDIWYMPQGNSWAARFIDDANGAYLWQDSEGTGSLSLNLETVLDKGRNAQIWIGPGQFSDYEKLQESHSVYAEFDAFQNKNIYTFNAKKGANGGVLYYELAPNRPDIVLKDMVKILHPELLPEYELFFFSPLK